MDTIKDNHVNKDRLVEIKNDITNIKEKQITQGNRIHDLETHKEIIVKKLDEVSRKLDTLLEKVITYLTPNN